MLMVKHWHLVPIILLQRLDERSPVIASAVAKLRLIWRGAITYPSHYQAFDADLINPFKIKIK